MRPNEAPCSPVEPCGAQWNPMEPSGTPWSPYGALWSPVEPLWGPMEPCGALWSSAVLWSPVKLYDDPNAHPKNASMSVSESASDFVFRIAEMMARKCDPIFRSPRFSMVEKSDHKIGRKIGRAPETPSDTSIGHKIGHKIGYTIGRKIGYTIGRKIGHTTGRKTGHTIGRRTGCKSATVSDAEFKRSHFGHMRAPPQRATPIFRLVLVFPK